MVKIHAVFAVAALSATRFFATAAAAVSVIVDVKQLLVIVLIRMLIAQRIVCVIHTGSEIRVIEIFVLMIESESVSDFLAHHEISPGHCIVSRSIKIRIIELNVRRSDVIAANRNSGNSEPAVKTVSVVADFDFSGCRPASSRVGLSGYYRKR